MTLKAGLAAAAFAAASMAATGASALAITVDSGWIADEITAAAAPSNNSDYTFTLTDDAWFRVTDAFSPGDTFEVREGATLILTTEFVAMGGPFGDDFDGDDGWTSASYSSGQVLLGAGSYALTVSGDGVAGLPAGFYVRLDTAQASAVPLPAALPAMLAALGGFGLARMRRRG